MFESKHEKLIPLGRFVSRLLRSLVIAGDTLADFGRGIEINTRWLRGGVTREQVADGLRPLLELPVDRVLASHGGPFDRAALERALA